MANPEPTTIEPEAVYYTADMVRALNEAEAGATRYECVYGALVVSPAPGELHQRIVTRLAAALVQYIAVADIDAVVYVAPADISWGRDDVTVQPDVFVVPRTMAREAGRTSDWGAIRHLLLAVEVSGTDSLRGDRFDKRRVYQAQNVPLYWSINLAVRTAEIWTPEAHFPVIERERLVWHPDGANEPLVIALDALFAEP
jgi:Uma2 family endonuclease